MYHSLAYSFLCAIFLMAPVPMHQDWQPKTDEPEEIVIPPIPDGVPLHGTVLTPDGSPAVDADVGLATGKQGVYIHEGKIIQFTDKEEYVLKTNAAGQFQFPYFHFPDERQAIPPQVKGTDWPPVHDYILIIFHDSGVRQLVPKDMEEAIYKKMPIQLEGWGQVEGTVYTGTKPAEDVDIMFSPNFVTRHNPWNPSVHWGFSTTSDADGKFVFEKVPPGKGYISRGTRILDRENHKSVYFALTFEVDVVSDESVVTEKIGGKDRPVIGKLVQKDTERRPEGVYRVCLCEQAEKPDEDAYNELYENVVPESIREESDIHTRYRMLAEWENTTEEGKAFAPVRQEYNTKKAKFQQRTFRHHSKLSGIGTDGTFRIDEVPEGDWQLEVVSGDAMGGLREDAPLLAHPFQMPPIPNGVLDDPLDVGTLILMVTVDTP
jgi:hypothetical protein